MDARDVGDRLEPAPFTRIVGVGHHGGDVLAACDERFERAGADRVIGENDPPRARHSSTSAIT
jgi:hypothetical protein